jgi:2-amino-4-hydroxy-6-hydroxymethyldihydropteridine diphosphokinase
LKPEVHTYAIALGSNRPHGRFGLPEEVLRAAVAELGKIGQITSRSRIHRTAAVGPAGRSFANAAILLETGFAPEALLARLKALERRFGRRGGRRWGPRVLDLDIILWSGGRFRSSTLDIPHPQMAQRRFVLGPLSEIAPDWPVAGTALRVRHLARRVGRY